MTTKYLHLLGVSAKASLLGAMQYRSDFLLQGLMSLYWLAWNLVPLIVLFGSRDSVAGWDAPSALVVIGWFTVLRGILEGAINPSLVDIVERIRTGGFDYVLLKPADAQFLVSTSRFAPWKLVDVFGGIALIAYAFVRLERAPSPADLSLAAVLLAASLVTLYALWISVVSVSFWVIRLDNLTYLLSSIFDAARWPVHVFRGAWRFVFTFVIPLAVMTTYPAMALLGRLSGTTAVAATAGAALALVISRLVWRRALASYTSASS